MDELRKHIRNAMLALNLIIASFLVVASLPPQTVYQRATDEARGIRTIAERWSSFQMEGLLKKWLDLDPTRAKRTTADEMVINAKFARPASNAGDFSPANSGDQLAFSFRPNPTTNVPVDVQGRTMGASIFVANARDGRDAGLPKQISTIGEFKAFWNGLPKASDLLWVNGFSEVIQANILFRGRLTDVTQLQGVSVTLDRAEEPYSPSGARFINSQDRTYLGIYNFALLDRTSANVQKLDGERTPIFELTQKSGATAAAYMYVGMKFERFDGHLQTLISDGLPIAPGTFDESFANIKEVIGEFDGFRISDLDAFILLISRLTADQAKLFGLSVPQTIVFTWGCIIIFLAHAFVLSHVHAYLRHYDYAKAELTDWLGDDDSIVSKAFSLFFLVATPLIGCAFLIWQHFATRVGGISIWLSASGSLLLAISCGYLAFLMSRHWKAMAWQRRLS